MRRLLVFTIVLAACSTRAVQLTSAPIETRELNVLSSAEKAEGWQLLFDGKTLNGWHALGFSTPPNSLWVVENGTIKHIEKAKGPTQADGQPLVGWDLISDSSYQNFELSWEWKISEAGNSGVKYNVSEELSTRMAPPHAAKGWEYQINDDVKNEDSKIPNHRSGSLYDMFEPNVLKRVNPAGEWNSARIVFRDGHGEHWMNHEKIVEFDIGSPAFDSAFARSKYSKYPEWFAMRRMPADIGDLAGTPELLQLRQMDIHQGTADVYEVAFAAGAGYGDPIERDPEAVRQDVEVGDISREAARDVFRVVLTGDTAEPVVDRPATEALRHAAIVERLGREPKRPSRRHAVVRSVTEYLDVLP